MPLKASCRQWAGRAAPGSPLLRPLPSLLPAPPPRAKLTSRLRVRPNHTPLGGPKPAPASLSPRMRTPGRPSPPATPRLPTPLLPPRPPNPREKNGRELCGTRAWLQHFGNERNCRRAPEHPEFSRSFCIQ